MRFELERTLAETEDFLFRQLSSRAAREAQKRKVQRGIGEVLRRMRRSALLTLLLLTSLIAYSIVIEPIGFLTWLLALPAVFLAAMLALFWPSRRRAANAPAAGATAARLEILARDSEEWLLERCRELPRAALPSVDRILLRLNDMQPELAALPADSPLAGETHRLIGQHLPRLVDAYLALPPAGRDPRSENSQRLAESLDIVADELTRLSGEVSHDRSLSFETQRRFIETRYRDQ